MRTPTGSVRKCGSQYFARITWTDPVSGKRRERRELFNARGAAIQRISEWRRQWTEFGAIRRSVAQDSADVIPRAFCQLADYYEQHYAIEPTYREDKKIGGLRSWATSRGHVKHLRSVLGNKLLEGLSWGDLQDAQNAILNGKTRYGKLRSIAYTNRIMSTCRRMLKIARQRKWMQHNPFAEGDPLIHRAYERERQRILTSQEEIALLKACEDMKRPDVKAIIVVAVETGMRLGEILRLDKEQIDWESGVILVKASHTKTMEERIVPMTARLRRSLQPYIARRGTSGSKIFFTTLWSLECAFRGARNAAGVYGLRFHDLRHSAATRMIEAGVPEALVGRILGHKVAETTRRYVNMHLQAAKDVAAIMNRSRSLSDKPRRHSRA